MTENVSPAFPNAKELSNVKVAYLSGYNLDASAFSRWKTRTAKTGTVTWKTDADRSSVLGDFTIAESFLLSKQLFQRGKQPIPSFPPIRGALQAPAIIHRDTGDISVVFDFVLSYFSDQEILLVYAYTKFATINVDQLIYIKECKWHDSSDSRRGWSYAKTDGTFEAAACYSDLAKKLLKGLGLKRLHDEQWPIFDFIELSDFGPGVGGGPNSERRLTLSEHWGLLSGDEGYRLIAEEEPNYSEFITKSSTRFRGRRAFLYNFFPTSCLAFSSSDRPQQRQLWRDFYRQHVAYDRKLDDYTGFAPAAACLTDGIPLIVEVCLLRYIELARVDQELDRDDTRSIFSFIWARLWGLTAVERAVSLMQKLDLYQESSLWIIGGEYANNILSYNSIRSRIDRRLEQSRFSASDVRLFYLGLLSLAAAIVAILITFIGK